jgi:hypothetical protein
MTDTTPTDWRAMTDLSPAAQAVLDAFENASDGEYVEGVWVVNERTMLAAALRAAADQVYWSWDPCTDLLTITAELEGKQ